MTVWDFLNANADGIGWLIFVGMLSLLIAYVIKKLLDLEA